MARFACSMVGLVLAAGLTFNGAKAQTPVPLRSQWYQPTAADVLRVQDLMAWYALDNFEGTMDALKDIFALNTPGTSWQTPRGPITTAGVIAEIDQEAQRRAGPADPGGLHVQSLMTPLLVFSGDGKTARGLWDSFGPNVNGINDIGRWLWIKYAVDFIREDGEWKIWHLQVYSVFVTPYNESWTQSAKDGSNNRPPPGMRLPTGGAPPGPPPGSANGSASKMWVYDGKTVMPVGKPFIPVPYYSFDPATAYVEK